MAGILVTVGMAPYQFDRLITAVSPLCSYHDVFVQTGVSAVTPPCPHAAYVALDEFQRRLADADIVITHGGGTVRLVQRLGRLPLAVPRLFRRGEAADDRQTSFLRAEESRGCVQTVWDVGQLPAAVAAHRRRALPMPLPPPVSDADLTATMESLCTRLLGNERLTGRPAPR
jgi:UDP-N-acetylglucosamine transferase subunit ALG13